MSHTTTLKGLAIKDVSAIRAAVAELKTSGVNVELLTEAKPRMYYADQHRRDGGYGHNEGTTAFVLKLPGRYDVGLDLKQDGTYNPVFDEFAGDVAASLGALGVTPAESRGFGYMTEASGKYAIGRFLQGYAKHAAINAAQAQGYFVESAEVDTKGSVQLVLTGM